MKRTFTSIMIFTLLLGGISLLAASEGEKRPFFDLELVPMDPLFREPLADPFAPSSSINYMTMNDEESVPHTVLISDGEQYQEVSFRDVDFERNYEFFQLKSAVNVAVLRLSVGPLQVEGFLQGGISATFQGFGALDTLGFGGIYAAGANVRLFDRIALQGGLHHFSGHWGDETIITLAESGVDLATTKLEEYTRGNSWLVGISIELDSRSRFYGFAERPMDEAWVRPGIHVPSYVAKPGSPDQSQFDYITGQEGLSGLEAPDPSYKAWRLQCGMEYRLPVLDLGSIFLAADFQFHQDGMTGHQVGGYSQDNPWESEFTAGGGIEFDQTLLGRKLRLQVYYHDGRFPEMNYFYQRSRFISLGFAIGG